MRGAARLLERCFWAIGFLAVSLWLAVWLTAKWYQAEGNRELERRVEESRSTKTASRAPSVRLAKGDLIGRIEIPRLDLSTVIFEGDDDDTLKMGVGHLSGSPLPGEAGNVVLAAHRDTFFRPLRDIRNRDRIDVITPAGTRRYQVDSTNIVTPDHIQVLAPTQTATLTLVTCFPFDWFGHAPMRFIVRAHQLNSPRSVADSTGASTQTSAQTPEETSRGMTTVDAPSPGALSPRDLSPRDLSPRDLSPRVLSNEPAPAPRKVWRRDPDVEPRVRTVPVAATGVALRTTNDKVTPRTTKLEVSPTVTKNTVASGTSKDGVPQSATEKTVAPSPAKNLALSATKDTGALHATKDEVAARPSSDEATPRTDSAPTAKPSGNRFLRGLKKLNPAPVLAKITGNS